MPSSPRWSLILFALALAGSGAAALLNQVVWQRALARFLGGVESHSAMVVVLVFMFGLGVGSLLTGSLARRLARPALWLAALELALAVLGLGVRWLAGADMTVLIAGTQEAIAGWGVPLRVVYGLSAAAILLPPCLVMGATLPLASEAAERSFGMRSSRTVPLLFALNTLGSVAGAFAGGWLVVPLAGYQATMLLSAALNAAAAVGFVACLRAVPALAAAAPVPAVAPPADPALTGRWFLPLASATLGFIALGFEMLLLRTTALLAEPLPHIFASVLGLYLLAWGVGCLAAAVGPALPLRRLLVALVVGLALVPLPVITGHGAFTCLVAQGLALAWAADPPILRRGRRRVFDVLLLAAFCCGIVEWNMPTPSESSLAIWVVPYAPVVVLGLLFGRLSDPRAAAWGAHAGLVAGANTLGSCLGLLVMTLVLFNCSTLADFAALVALAGLLALAASGLRPRWRGLGAAALVAVVVAAVLALRHHEPYVPQAKRTWSSSEGVIGIDSADNLMWNGLWHSRLSDGRNHVGGNNWHLSVMPAILGPAAPKRCAVIGLGTGISVVTLAKLPTVERVDCLEINPALAALHRAYPAGTLGCLDHPKVRMIWNDARLQLATDAQTYDLVMTQPVYLKQAGSAYLNSLEMLTLVRDRLSEDGVFCLYSNGTPAQALAMRQTARRVFPHMTSCMNGYLLLLSKKPCLGVGDLEAIERRIAGAGDLATELRGNPPTATAAEFALFIDEPPLIADGDWLVNTDDTAHLEHPRILAERAARHLPGVRLPQTLFPMRRTPKP